MRGQRGVLEPANPEKHASVSRQARKSKRRSTHLGKVISVGRRQHAQLLSLRLPNNLHDLLQQPLNLSHAKTAHSDLEVAVLAEDDDVVVLAACRRVLLGHVGGNLRDPGGVEPVVQRKIDVLQLQLLVAQCTRRRGSRRRTGSYTSPWPRASSSPARARVACWSNPNRITHRNLPSDLRRTWEQLEERTHDSTRSRKTSVARTSSAARRVCDLPGPPVPLCV